MIFPRNKFEISTFLSITSFIENSGKNVLAGAHKKFYRIQHPEIYLLDLKVQYKHKMKLLLDMVSKLPDYKRKGNIKAGYNHTI